ncbi:MAG TPA: ABC transporter ATP-binding protein, partial [Hyphomicrobiales bacterium]|nr:ABC transporter ATP-binding protein [Hyphomicrobiales bacterium]
RILAKVDVLENLGGVSFAYAHSGTEQPLVIELKNRTAPEGQLLATGFDPKRSLLFDPKTEMRLR